ncbi:MAG TPA: hypothetical protein VEF89_33730 [Solirubrobacteraceae bacterium]|nr:hypothetical protein [Solirubrobacteraceae bacterium]
MTATRNQTEDRWSQLSRGELIALGRRIVTERLESLGCTVQTPSSRIDSKLEVRTPSGRSIEVFVSTQRLGGYVFWTKRRLQPAGNRFAAVASSAGSRAPPSGWRLPLRTAANIRTATGSSGSSSAAII